MRATSTSIASRPIGVAALLVSLLASPCASNGVRTAEEVKGWERCDGSWPQNLSYVCFRR